MFDFLSTRIFRFHFVVNVKRIFFAGGQVCFGDEQFHLSHSAVFLHETPFSRNRPPVSHVGFKKGNSLVKIFVKKKTLKKGTKNRRRDSNTEGEEEESGSDSQQGRVNFSRKRKYAQFSFPISDSLTPRLWLVLESATNRWSIAARRLAPVRDLYMAIDAEGVYRLRIQKNLGRPHWDKTDRKKILCWRKIQ